jgi:hypothetical protein
MHCRTWFGVTRIENAGLTADPLALMLDRDKNANTVGKASRKSFILLHESTMYSWQKTCITTNRNLKGGVMSYDIYCVAQTDEQARNIVEEIKTMGVAPEAVKVISKPDQVGNIDRNSEELRNALRGAVGGTVIGSLFGAAVLNTMGMAGIPGIFEAVLLLACAALGGAMFGAIVGSTGLFARKRLSTPLEYHLENEITYGHILVSVRAENPNEREDMIGLMHILGATDVHYTSAQAA